MEDQTPRKGQESDERLRKPPPSWILLLRSIALSIIVTIPCALLVGVGARLIYEFFKVGWNLFGY